MTPAAIQVDCEKHHPALAVSDVRAAVDFYTSKLGFTLGFLWGEPPTMAGVNLGQAQMFLEHGTPCPSGCSVYFVVGNADELHEFQRGNGVEVVEPPGDRPYGLRDYRVRDLHGYHLGFGQYIYTVGPPIEIERVDVPVRLEKRLAAVLADLAAYKHMTLTSCLEETLLHTFEPLGDGVASPHTRSDLRHIQELKKKHGIDYDSHGSYLFVERPGIVSGESPVARGRGWWDHVPPQGIQASSAEIAMPPIAVQLRELPSIPLAVIRRQACPSDLLRVVPECCGLVWNAVRAQQAQAGRHVALYWDASIRLEVGVEMLGPFADQGDVVRSATPEGAVAMAVHFGPYSGLGLVHDAIHEWCRAHHHRLTGARWEIYGHWQPQWDSDPSQIQTDVFYQIAAR